MTGVSAASGTDPDGLSIELGTGTATHTMRLSGRLRITDTPLLMAALGCALASPGPGTVVCDLTRLAPPADAISLTVFAAAVRRSGGWPTTSLHLAGAGPELAGQLERLSMQRYVPVHATVAEAMLQAELESAIVPHQIPLEPRAASVRAARRLVRDLWPGGDGERCDDALLVTDELAANAIQHVAQPFTVSVSVSSSRVLVAVTDPSRDEPVVRAPQDEQASGRGMWVVSALSGDWGVRLVHQQGKTVWASMPVSA